MPRRRTRKIEGGGGPLRAVATLIDRAKPKFKEEDPLSQSLMYPFSLIGTSLCRSTQDNGGDANGTCPGSDDSIQNH